MNTIIMTPHEKQNLLQAIKDARAPIAAFSLGVAAFMHPTIRQILIPSNGYKVLFGTAQCPFIKTGGDNKVKTSEHYTLLLDPSLSYVTENPSNSFVFISLAIKSALLHVGDAFADVGYLDRSPELEFLRHIRNAVAHGNKFNITAPLKFKASFKTYLISENLHGNRLLRDNKGDGYLYIGDALSLLDFLELKIESYI